jgi:hypothetical protein
MRVNTRSAPERSTRTLMPELRLEVLAELLGELQVHGGVEDALALLLRRLDQRRRDRLGRRRCGAHWLGEHRADASAVEPFRMSRGRTYASLFSALFAGPSHSGAQRSERARNDSERLARA